MDKFTLWENAKLGKAARSPILPWIGSLAFRMDRRTIREIFWDVQALVDCLMDIQRSVDYDCIALPPDMTAESEAMGIETHWPDRELPQLNGQGTEEPLRDTDELIQTGRINLQVEAVRRLVRLNPTVPVMGVITGPVTLYSRITGRVLDEKMSRDADLQSWRIAKSLPVALCRAYGEARAWGVCVVEDASALSDAPDAIDESLKVMNSVCNTALYYRCTPFVTVFGSRELPEFSRALLSSANAVGVTCSALSLDQKLPRGKLLGIPVTPTKEGLEQATESRHMPGVFITTPEPCGRDVSIEQLRAIVEVVSS